MKYVLNANEWNLGCSFQSSFTESCTKTSKLLDIPKEIIVMSKKETLLMFSWVVNNPNTGYKVNNIFCCCQIQVVSALMTTIAVYPL